MKRLVLLAVVASVAFVGCKKDQNENGNGTLEPTNVQRAWVWETTGAWCGYCPNGAEMLRMAEHAYGGKILPIGYHTGDALQTATGQALASNFPTSGVPNFYVNNQNSGQSIDANIQQAISQAPAAGVGHTWTYDEGAKTFNVSTKVKFFTAGSGEYYVGCYVLQGPINASDNLTQSDYTNRLEDRPDGSHITSFWKVDAAIINGNALLPADSRYVHAHSIYAHGGDNPFGQRITAPAIGANESFTFDYSISSNGMFNTSGASIVTVLWKKNGSTYEFVNGYHH
jgi:hypothetical protein